MRLTRERGREELGGGADLGAAVESEEERLDREDAEDEAAQTGPSAVMESGRFDLLRDRRRVVLLAVAFVLVVVAIYVLIPAIVGLDDALARFSQATWYWLVIAFGFTVAGFGGYVALLRGLLGGTRDDLVRRRLDFSASYQITMASLAATRIFSAAGAGGIALAYWALRRAGMPRRRAAVRMVSFLALLYTIYLLALVLFGVLLRTDVLPGPSPAGGTIVPAAIAGAALVVIVLIALIPGDLERRLRSLSRNRRSRVANLAARVATGPATVAAGVRLALEFARHPRRGALAITGAVGWWAANIATLWASFEAFGGDVPFAVLVQGFFVGMTANLLPSPAGGVGTVDAGMIAAFLLFGLPTALVFPAVLMYRVMAFWLPIPPGVVAYFQLRRTVAGWGPEDTGRYPPIQNEVTAKAT
jgi:uncharacterized protein (TIRG00374 family)